MAYEGFKRQLTAILSADVVGNGRLMGSEANNAVSTCFQTSAYLK